MIFKCEINHLIINYNCELFFADNLFGSLHEKQFDQTFKSII